MDTMMNTIQEIFKDVFGDDNLVITMDTSPDDIDEWDSLIHITLLQVLQQEFDVEFDVEEISKINTVKDMVDTIKRKTGAC